MSSHVRDASLFCGRFPGSTSATMSARQHAVLRAPAAVPVRLRPRAGSLLPPPVLPAGRTSFATGVPCVRTAVSAAPRAGSRRGAGPPAVAAFRLFGKAGAVRVPLDFYLVLHVPARAPAGAVDDAVVDRTAHPPASSGDLSPGALASRAQLLSVAGATLSNLSSRAAFDTALAAGTASLDVPLDALPGALLLLQVRLQCPVYLDSCSPASPPCGAPTPCH